MLTPAERRLVATELSSLVGAWVQKVSLAAPRTVSLELRLPGRSIGLRLDGTPGLCRACVVTDRLAAPQPPLPWQAQLRHQLEEARLVSVTAEGRTLVLAFETPRGERRLVLEFDRRAGELLLLDGTGKVLGWGEGEGPRARGLRRGGPWSPPRVEGEREVPSRFVAGPEPFGVSAAIVAAYATEGVARSDEGLRRALMSALRASHDKLARTVGRVEDDLRRMDQAEAYRRLGDLLKPLLPTLRRGMTEAPVPEWARGEDGPATVPLLPALSPHENLDRYYRLHKRLTRSRPLAEERRKGLSVRLQRLQQMLQLAETADAAGLRELDVRLRAEQPAAEAAAQGRRQSGRTATRKPQRTFRSAAGHRIWVGRGARDNDALTFGLARGNDLWLHARGHVGSHVVVPGIENPDGETLLDAATLAAHFSGARGELRVDVVATARKHVRRVRDGAPGAVLYAHEKTVPLRLDYARLSRLLASESTD